jgi:basic amino acid/polyamine antiporter, APA family
MTDSAQVTAAETATSGQRTLERTLGFGDVFFIVIGSVIGSGIFLVPGVVVRDTAGDYGIALAVWLVAGVLSLLGALTYGELCAMVPEAGGLYVFIRDAFGELPAFLFGWTLFFVISSGATATLGVAFATYLDQFVTLGPIGDKAVALLMIAAIGAINIRGTRQSADVQNWTTGIKVAAILLMSIALIVLGHGITTSRAHFFTAPATAGLFSGIGIATVAVLWAYEGWQFVTYSAGEVRQPERNFAGGIALGTLTLIGIYIVANIGYVAAIGSQGVAGTDRVASVAVTALLGPTLGKVIGLAILVSIFSAANSTILTAPRVYFAMARDGVFFRKLAEVHPRFRTPAFSIATSCLWAMILAASGTFEQLLTYVVFAGWIFYGLAAAAVFVYRRRRPDAHRPFRVPGYPVTPILFLLAAAAIVLNTIFAEPARAAVGLGIVFTGLPAYLIWRRRA